MKLKIVIGKRVKRLQLLYYVPMSIISENHNSVFFAIFQYDSHHPRPTFFFHTLDYVGKLMPAQCQKIKEIGDLMTGELAIEATVNGSRLWCLKIMVITHNKQKMQIEISNVSPTFENFQIQFHQVITFKQKTWEWKVIYIPAMILVEVIELIVHIDRPLHMLCHLKGRNHTEYNFIHFISGVKFSLFLINTVMHMELTVICLVHVLLALL